MGFFLNLLSFNTYTMLIIGLAIGYIVFATFLSRWLTNAKKMRQIQYRVKILSKQMNELVKAKAPPGELIGLQKELLGLTSQSMMSSFKPLIILLPITIILYDVILPALVPAASKGTAQGLFFWCLLGGGIIAAIITYYWDKKMLKKELSVQVVTQTTKIGQEI